MALAIDASSPVAVSSATGVPTTASFNPPASSLLVVKVAGDWFGGTPSIAVTSTGLAFERVVRHGALNQGVVEIWVARVGTGARTVSATTSLGSSPLGLKVEVWTGFDPGDPIDAVAGNTGITTNSFNGSLTTVSNGAWATGVGADWQNLGAATSTDTNEHSEPGGVAILWVRKAAALATAGAETLNFDAAGTGTPMWTWAAIALRSATAGSPTIYRVADRGTAANTLTSTSTAVSMSAAGSIGVGNYLIARVALDNAGTNGVAPSCTVTDPRSNTWTVLGPGLADPGAANAGSTLYVAYCKVVNAYTNADSVTFNHSPTVPAKAIVIEEWTGIDGTTPIAVSAVNASGATAAASLAITPTAAGQVLYAAISEEGIGGDHYTQDTDIVSGSWVALNQNASVNATATNNQATFAAYKRVTASGAQTWNATLPGARDWAGVAFVLAPAAATGATGTLAGTLSTQTASLAGTAKASGPIAGTLAAQTASLVGTVSGPVSGTLSATLSAITAALAASAKTSGPLAGSLSAQTMTAAGTAKASGPIAGSLSGQVASMTGAAKASGPLAGSLAAQTSSVSGTVTDSGTLVATLASQVASMTGSAKASAALVGQLAAMTANLQGQVQVLSAQGSLDGTLVGLVSSFVAEASTDATLAAAFSSITADVTAGATAAGTLAGLLAAQTMTAVGHADVADRDIIVVVGPSEWPVALIEPGSLSPIVQQGSLTRTAIVVGIPTTSVEAGGTHRATIGVGKVDKQWRNGSKQFIDFTVTLVDPEGGLTLAEVEAIPFEVLVTLTSDTPALTDTGWAAPTVPKSVVADGSGFKVSILTLYTATAKGMHYVWVKFGPTPEEPIYQAATFLSL